jgi:hypothetical protein
MMTLLTILFALEIGALPRNNWVLYPAHQISIAEEITYYTELEAEIQIGGVLFGRGSVRTDVTPEALTDWRPFWTQYEVIVGARLGIVEIGFRHLCTHPIITYAPFHPDITPLIEGAYEEVYVRIGTLPR